MRVLSSDNRAAVSVEAALALGLVMVPLLVALVDFGFALTVRMHLDRAVQAGLFYAWGTTGASVSAIQSASVAGYGAHSPTATAAATEACYCINPAGTRAGGTVASCTATCGSGLQLATWLTVQATATVALPAPLPLVGSALSLSSTATARVQ